MAPTTHRAGAVTGALLSGLLRTISLVIGYVVQGSHVGSNMSIRSRACASASWRAWWGMAGSCVSLLLPNPLLGSMPNLMRNGWPVASDRASFFSQSSWGSSSSQPRKDTARDSRTRSVTGCAGAAAGADMVIGRGRGYGVVRTAGAAALAILGRFHRRVSAWAFGRRRILVDGLVRPAPQSATYRQPAGSDRHALAVSGPPIPPTERRTR